MSTLIPRGRSTKRLRDALARAPVVLLTGPRQAGKTTLARQWAEADHWFDAEDPADAAALSDPMLALERLSGLVAIDEAQRVPDLFPVLRVLVDRNMTGEGSPARFLILGSASPDLVGLAAESLAGRVELVELSGLSGQDVGAGDIDKLWLRGGLPPSFTASSDVDSATWRDQYITTFLERDLGQLGSRVPSATMRRAWAMLAHYHGQAWNGAEFARSMDVSESSARRYLDTLTSALVIRQLQPWFANIGKRQRKSPRIYVRDTGLLHRLLGVDDAGALDRHPKVGASWEGFVVEQLAALLTPQPLWFWRTQDGAEVDLLTQAKARTIGFEIKRTSAPRATRSMHIAVDDLALDHLVVVYPGRRRFSLSDTIEVVGAQELLTQPDLDGLIDALSQ